MTASHLLPADLSKEVRALLPVWLLCVVVIWAGGHDDPFLFRGGFLTYMLGSAALGALSIGHEYTNRTLPLLLSLPISRRRLFAIKASVLLPMLLTLAAIANARLPVTPVGRDLKDTALVGLLSLLSSAFLAPWLTMVCRNAIAGGLFALSMPAALLLASELGAIAVYGVGQVDTPMFQRLRMEVLWGGMALLSGIGAVSSWRAFMRLEAIEGSHSEFRWPRLLGRAGSSAAARETSRRIHPVRSLVRKELHLQQLTFVVSALYFCGWIAALIAGRLMGTRDVETGLLILTVVHGAIVALLSGSLASAEERHLGVLQAQVLMPMSMARQWVIKVGVVFGLCVVLAMALPAALLLISEGASTVNINVPFAVTVILLAAVALYVSSVSTSGVKALLISGPAALSLAVLIPALGDVVLWAGRMLGIRSAHDAFGRALALIVVMVFSLLVGFALTNHRSSDPSPRGIWRQILWLSGSVVCVVLIALFAR